MTDVFSVDNPPPFPDNQDGFSPEDLDRLIQKICEADAALSSLGVTLPIRNEARAFRDRFMPKLDRAAKEGRLPLLAKKLYEEAWAFYADHYLPALKLKEEIDKALRTGRHIYIDPKTGEKLGFAFPSPGARVGERDVLWVGYQYDDFTGREMNFRIRRKGGHLMEPTFSEHRWAACWEKKWYDLEDYCRLFNVCPKLATAPWVYSWRGDEAYWKYTTAVEGEEEGIYSDQELDALESVVLPIEGLPSTEFTYARTLAACFLFDPNGLSEFFYPKNLDPNQADPVSLFIKQNIRCVDTLEERRYCPPEAQFDSQVYDVSYGGQRYEFTGGSGIIKIQEKGGKIIIPVIICNVQTYHESGLCITQSISFRNQEESGLFARALELQLVEAMAAARRSGRDFKSNKWPSKTHW